MLSDEEKKAIEYLKRHIIPYYEKKGTIEFMLNDTILNLIEKQSKEIEELTDKNKKLKDKAKELIFEKQELTSALLDSTPNDKIKAKIDEVDKDENASIPDFIEYAKEYATQKLQSLLEKEGE